MKVQRPSRKVSESSLVASHLMMPQDANIQGNVYGGTIMKLMDEIAGVVAARHCRKNVVTASIDQMSFLKPVYIGNLLVLKASVNYVGTTSLEIGVRIEAEDIASGKIVHTGSSYMTFVALDDEGRPTEVPSLVPTTKAEKTRFKEAMKRRQARLQAANKLH
ncbi:MAG: acyl-CoA thioesterase [Nitrososphaerales archaeon]